MFLEASMDLARDFSLTDRERREKSDGEDGREREKGEGEGERANLPSGRFPARRTTKRYLGVRFDLVLEEVNGELTLRML